MSNNVATVEEMKLAQEFLRSMVEPEIDSALQAQISCVKQGWGLPRMAKSIYGARLTLGGRKFEHGIGTHADSELVVKLASPGARFSAFVGVDDNPYSSSVTDLAHNVFSVEVAGSEVWRSKPLTVKDEPVEVEVELGGATEFTLKVTESDRRLGGAHADWAGATVTLHDGSELPIGQQDRVNGPAISFRYDGKESRDLLSKWPMRYEACELCIGTKHHRMLYRDPATGLQVLVEIKEYADFPALEWVVTLRNTGDADTPIIEDIQALDMPMITSDKVILRKSKGSDCEIDDFLYTAEPIEVSQTVRLTPVEGRSSAGCLPFFNIESGDKGLIAGIGWTGCWAAEFNRKNSDVMTIRAGMEKTHLKLHPGEEIRTPSILLMFWEGDPLRAHNMLRRFILEHHTPLVNGKKVEGPLTCATWGGTVTDRHLVMIDSIKKNGLEYDYYWIDAGWYGPSGRACPDVSSDWAEHVGDWNCNRTAHPTGLGPVSDAARAAGMKFLLWIEPERAVYGTPWTLDHPEWFLGEPRLGGNMLFNLGLPEAREWMTDFISGMIDEYGIECYRQDFNMDPLSYWRANDAPDRQGMTEIRHIEGLYAFWDALLERHPGLMIDNCASGGRRLDLETTGRSIPLWRSDYQCAGTFDPTGSQVHTHGLSYWLPLSATGTDMRPGDTYNVRSNFSAGLSFMLDLWDQNILEQDYPFEWHKRMTREFKRARPFYYGDYYPLTACTASNDQWMVYQMDRSDLAEGMLLAFRRDESPFTSAVFKLKAMDSTSVYELEDADSGQTWTASGAELANDGIAFVMDKPRESRLVFYRKA